VLVEARPGTIELLTPLYQRLIDANAVLNARYTDRQLAVVVKYLSEATALAAEHVTWLQTEPPLRRANSARSHRTGRTASARSGRTRGGRLQARQGGARS
jgi:GTP1/Obg family GTP-binding protein